MTTRKAQPEPTAEKPTVAKNTNNFPVVGIGASAGGVAAFEAFFSGMPADVDPGMAFVVVQHLSPDHKSILSEIIRRYTRMEVYEVEDGMAVHPNCTYIIPPNRDMALINGTLQLLEPTAPRSQRLTIDYFFRSLAKDQLERAICVVLSGTGSDGSLGVRAVKGEGGMAMAQLPESAEYDGMPCSAINTELVDYILLPGEMPAQIIAYVARAFSLSEPGESRPKADDVNAVKKLMVLLRVQTGHDFSQYKLNTVLRRIERRMAVQLISNLDDYVKFMQRNSDEADALFNDLLIGVTNFFRDPEAFRALEQQVIPKLFADKPRGSTIRIWTAGCSTGEEAYSIAILLQEQLEALKQSYKWQVFASDIDSRAIAAARTGVYPASIVTDISPERLARFFTLEPDGSSYRISKTIRDGMIFSEHNVIKDPPFSKLDLLSCRNLLIYMSGELQKKLFLLFHYALNVGGFMFLGTSESVGDYGNLFSVIDRSQKLYQTQADYDGSSHAVRVRAQLLMPVADALADRALQKPDLTAKISMRELTEQTLLQHAATVGILVDSQGNVLFIHGRTGRYLEPAAGEVRIDNVLKMARQGLRNDLTLALNGAVKNKTTEFRPRLSVKTNGDFTTVNLWVIPVETSRGSGTTLYLVVLTEAAAEPTDKPDSGGSMALEGHDDSTSIAGLRQELRVKDEFLTASNEELATSNEELKSANEEMQSVNEELQSANEELETSREELQSVNEELATVNTELQNKVADLTKTI